MLATADSSAVRKALLLAVTLGWIQTASAHELGIGRVQLTWSEAGELVVEASLPPHAVDVEPVFPARCDLSERVVRTDSGSAVRILWRSQCGADDLSADDRLTAAWPVEGLFVTGGGVGATQEGQFLDPVDDGFAVRLQTVFESEEAKPGSFAAYFRFGAEHILSGWDHLAFVAALCLIASGMRLVKLVTAFTLGHSLTLGLSSVGWLNVPALPLEACIALSVAFVAREAVLRPGSGHGAWVVVAFGLLHGLGFAGALSDAGIGSTGLLAALLAFNLGVEAGQLLFVAVLLAAMAMIPRRFDITKAHLAFAWGLGTLGAFWTIERTLVMLT